MEQKDFKSIVIYPQNSQKVPVAKIKKYMNVLKKWNVVPEYSWSIIQHKNGNIVVNLDYRIKEIDAVNVAYILSIFGKDDDILTYKVAFGKAKK